MPAEENSHRGQASKQYSSHPRAGSTHPYTATKKSRLKG